ncbi:MAG TPA: hypothetical protein VFW70_02610 [Methylomirabilota bacterium]|nr:hypothetical protein [Methylomirabilota bacterium]
MLGAAFVGALVLAPLAWRVWQDRRDERALAVRAAIHAAVVRALGGESFVAVNVRPGTLWRPGRVELSAPTDWRFLLEPAWSAVLPRVPDDWELVVTPLPATTGLITHQPALRHAA